ncbi:MAG: hypothetical protein WA532_02525 [Candidatus Korobacteraceae bacterium]
MPGDRPTLFATLTAYFYCLLVLLTMAAIFICSWWLFAPTQTERYWYSFTNGVPRSRVFVSPRPTDCYLEHSASASTKCHYKKVVEVGKDSSGNTQITVYWQKVPE